MPLSSFSRIFKIQGFEIIERGRNNRKQGVREPEDINNNVMQHREIITRNLERVEGNISKLESLLSRGGDGREFKHVLEQTRDIVQDVKDYIQREPHTPNEFNQ